MNKWYPNLTGKVPAEVDHAIKILFDHVYKPLDIFIPKPLSVKEISKELQTPGESPLNVSGLIGILSQPQKAMVSVSTVSGAPTLNNIPAPVSGQLQIQNGQLFFFDTSTNPGMWRAISAVATILEDLFINISLYNPVNYPNGTLFWALDKTVLYISQLISSVPTWIYILGTDTTSTIGSKPTLGVNDVGYKLYDPAWDHTWKWNGTAWHYNDNETEPGDVRLRASSVAPLRNGWHVADGSAGVTVSKDDATTTTITLPDLRTFYLKMAAAYTGSGVAAVAPTGSAGATVTSDDPSGDGITTASGSVAAGAGAPSTFLTSASFVPAVGGHHHSIPAITIGSNGTPPTFSLIPYYRL